MPEWQALYNLVLSPGLLAIFEILFQLLLTLARASNSRLCFQYVDPQAGLRSDRVFHGIYLMCRWV